jgi:predicted nucleic acid-binding Zn ribbon protein
MEEEFTKRSYFIRRKEALSMDQVVEEFIKSAKLASGLNTQRIFSAWDECSGAGPFTLKRYFRSGTLYITLSSSVWRRELQMRLVQILTRINELLREDPLFTPDDPRTGFVQQIILR